MSNLMIDTIQLVRKLADETRNDQHYLSVQESMEAELTSILETEKIQFDAKEFLFTLHLCMDVFAAGNYAMRSLIRDEIDSEERETSGLH